MRHVCLPLSLPLALLLGVACQEPFGADRHDLIGFRVAGLKARPVPESDPPRFQVSGALFVDGQPWTDAEIDWRWRWVADAAELAALGPTNLVHARGPAPVIARPDGALALGLLAVHEDGREYRSLLRIPTDPAHPWPALDRIDAALIEGVDLDNLMPEHVPAAAREGWATTAGPVTPGAVVRLSAALDPRAPNARTRWMSANGAGTFLELSRSEADWVAGEWVVDDEEVLAREPLAPGLVTGLTLLIDDLGGADYRAWELAVGEAPVGLRTTSGRFLPAQAHFGAGLVQGRLLADDASPVGLRLENARTVTRAELDRGDPFGTFDLPCTGTVFGPFDPNWLLDGRCKRADVAGATVVVEAQ